MAWVPSGQSQARSPIHIHGSPPRAHPVPDRGSAGPGHSPGRVFYLLMAFSKRNLRTTRPTAPRWKAHIEICQKARQKRVSVVLGEGQEVRGCAVRTEGGRA
eukprot:scaffold5080_cov72-Phaeocystis_antarctica.AAC.3